MDEEFDIALQAPKVHSESAVAHTADGTKVSMKNACTHCGYSLYWCKCSSPKAMTMNGKSEDVTISEI